MTASTLVLLSPPCATTAAWGRVMPLLEERGVLSTAVQLPAMLPTSELDDATFLRRFLDDLEEPVVLVGHSSNGWELTEVGAHPAVKHLVYVDAVVPDVGESMADFVDGIARELSRCVRVHDEVSEFDPVRFGEYLQREGWSVDDARELIAGMCPRRLAASVRTVTTTAWRSVPSTYIAPTDSCMSRDLQARFGARTTQVVEMPGDHFPHWLRPDETAEILSQIAQQATRS